MDMFIALGVIIALDVIAPALGFDSRTSHSLRHHDELDALKHGGIETYRVEIERMERDIARGTWPRF